MKIEIRIWDPQQPDRPSQTDWIPAEELPAAREQAREHGLRLEELGPVSWQRQLAAMENPPL